jgi:hypothetical protein
MTYMTTFHFGKHPPKRDYRTPRFGTYLAPGLPEPPEAYDVLPRVYKNLKSFDPTKLFPMDGNDSLGDCTIAALAHAITAFRGLIGRQLIMSRAAVVKLYLHLTGGIDSGLNALDVLNYWRKQTVSGDRILAFTGIDPRNRTHVRHAVQLFGGIYLGFQVQENCIADFEAGKAWTPGRLTTNGHAVFVTGYDITGVTLLTWGSIHRATWDWWNECVDEAYAIIPPEAKKKGFAPGFDFKQLQADLQAVGS